MDSIGPTEEDLFGTRGPFGRLASCVPAPWCEGHTDPVATSHGTPYDYFGPDGVVVTQVDGQPPVVSLIDFDPRQADFTPDGAVRLAFQILQAADLAARYAQPSATGGITRLLAEALAGGGR